VGQHRTLRPAGRARGVEQPGTIGRHARFRNQRLAGGEQRVVIGAAGGDDTVERRHRSFERRQRLIGGLCLGTLVVEAARYGAALLSARAAAESGREVFAIPGSIHSPLSRGCHQLIKEGAKLVEEAADVLSELRIIVAEDELTTGPSVTEQPEALDKEYEMLLDALAFEPATTDVLVARTHLPSQSVASMLLILELEGRVAALPGGRYGRLP